MKARSVLFSQIGCALWLIVLAALCVAVPFIASWYQRYRALSDGVTRAIIVAFYLCCLPAALALAALLRVLRNIRGDRLFGRQNTRLLYLVSWCCLAVAAICFAAAFWYMPLALISAAMLFIFLIVRVVCACFVAAAEIKEENRLTI